MFLLPQFQQPLRKREGHHSAAKFGPGEATLVLLATAVPDTAALKPKAPREVRPSRTRSAKGTGDHGETMGDPDPKAECFGSGQVCR